MTVRRWQQQGLSLDRGLIRRWLGVPGTETVEGTDGLIEEAAAFLERGSYAVCWCRLPLTVAEDACVLGGVLRLPGRSLAAHLRGCREAALFCATLGAEVDRRLLSLRLSPLRAAVLDAAAGAAIERLCDDFCAALPQPQRPRFSPGYGDLPLETQRPLLSLLDAQRLLGVTLTDALLMTPTKSVTAVVGLL